METLVNLITSNSIVLIGAAFGLVAGRIVGSVVAGIGVAFFIVGLLVNDEIGGG